MDELYVHHILYASIYIECLAKDGLFDFPTYTIGIEPDIYTHANSNSIVDYNNYKVPISIKSI